MSKRSTLLHHFRSFAYQNNISDIDKALEYFAVFGGTGWSIDTSKSIESLIEQKILCNYESLHKSMTRYTHNNPVYHNLLSIIALGTEYEHDAFKKAKIGKLRGEDAIDYLEKKSLLRFDLSIEEPTKDSDKKSDRLLFPLPFMRFWFAMVSPHYRGIADGDFHEFEQKWQSVKANFSILLSNLLVRELVQQSLAIRYTDDPIVSMGSYYDNQVQIGILAKSKSGKMIAGECKYSKDVAKVNMIESLMEKCKKSELAISEYVLFSKNGFSAEVEQMKDMELTLLSNAHLSSLLDDLNQNDLLVYKNKKY